MSGRRQIALATRGGLALGLCLLILALMALHSPATRCAEAGREGAPEAEPNAGREPEAAAPEPTFDAEMIESLLAIGYLRGSRPATRSGVTIHDPEKAFNGVNLYSSGHAPEARLIDMEGRTLHRWHLPYEEAFGEQENPNPNTRWWRRVALLPGGDLLAIYEGAGLVRIDKNSKLVWASPLHAHHDLHVMKSGAIYVLTREARMVRRISTERPTLEDFVVIMNSEGQVFRKLSLFEAFDNSRLTRLIRDGKRQTGDIFHTNTLVVLDGRGSRRMPVLKPGHLLVSMNALGVVAVLDPNLEQVVWVRKKPPSGQHDAQILDNGNMLLFNNNEGSGSSEVIEFDPVSGEVTWSYRGSEQQPFYSEFLGAAQRLPNGNTLITESNGGRAFEVTKQGEIVWEFHNPNRTSGAAPDGEQTEFVATLPELQRLPPGTKIGWATSLDPDAPKNGSPSAASGN